MGLCVAREAVAQSALCPSSSSASNPSPNCRLGTDVGVTRQRVGLSTIAAADATSPTKPRVMNLQFELELGEGDGAAELTVSTTPVARRALPTMRRRWCGDHQASHPARGDILPARGRAMDAGRWTTTRTTHRECVDASRRSPTLRVACGVLKPPGSPRTSRLSAAAGGR